ncbi:MAG: hypothetical protein WBD24_03695 [Candidatus Omnitrophota bacterium]
MKRKKIIILILIIAGIAVIAFGMVSSIIEEGPVTRGRKTEEKVLDKELREMPVTDEHVEEKMEEQAQDDKTVDIDA